MVVTLRVTSRCAFSIRKETVRTFVVSFNRRKIELEVLEFYIFYIIFIIYVKECSQINENAIFFVYCCLVINCIS